MALAGGLARASWEPQDIRHFIFEMAKAAGDEEAPQRANCVDGTEKKVQSDTPVTGWPRLSQLIGPHVVDRLRKWLVTSRDSQRPDSKPFELGRGKGCEKHRKISAIVIDELRDCGVFYKTSNELYYFDQLDCHGCLL